LGDSVCNLILARAPVGPGYAAGGLGRKEGEKKKEEKDGSLSGAHFCVGFGHDAKWVPFWSISSGEFERKKNRKNGAKARKNGKKNEKNRKKNEKKKRRKRKEIRRKKKREEN